MGYRKAETNSFAEYQVSKEGFGAAVTGNINSTGEVSRLAKGGMDSLPAGLQGLNGYEGYPSHLSQYPEFSGEFGDQTIKEASEIAIANMDKDPAGVTGLQGYEGDLGGFEGIEDDAFAGYGESTAQVAAQAQRAALDVDDEHVAFDGYGGLGEGPSESFHTFLHQASMARTDTGVISALKKAVKSVPDDTPATVNKQLYDLAKEMLLRRKQGNLRHLDLQRAEIESNLGWLVNPSLPKTGGFNAVVQKAVGKVGAQLAKGEKDQVKAQQALAVGQLLKKDLRKQNMLAGLGEGGKMTYIGLGLAGLLAVGVAYYLYTNNQKAAAAAAAAKKRRRRRRKKK